MYVSPRFGGTFEVFPELIPPDQAYQAQIVLTDGSAPTIDIRGMSADGLETSLKCLAAENGVFLLESAQKHPVKRLYRLSPMPWKSPPPHTETPLGKAGAAALRDPEIVEAVADLKMAEYLDSLELPFVCIKSPLAKTGCPSSYQTYFQKGLWRTFLVPLISSSPSTALLPNAAKNINRLSPFFIKRLN
ncbi:MAG: hypothetical protein IPK79_07575 [Vampirovibrionales bacterium]|nr:hypothetical protein [Vampirovibrionales bacterium]